MSKPTRPEILPEWATELVKDNISGQYNVYEPPEQKRKIGWRYKEKPPRQWLNWLHKSTYDWLRYFAYFLNRPEDYTNATKPTASSTNAGSIIFITDVDDGVLAYSTGAAWKKIK